MEKITYDKLKGFGDIEKSMFRLLYPSGLTMDQLKEKAEKFSFHRAVYERVKGD